MSEAPPVMQQPQAIPNAPPPPAGYQVPEGLHPSLAYLAQLDQLIVKQKVELLELISGWETANKYQICNNQKQQVFFAKEESNLCMRQCCHENRTFVMHIYDNNDQEVIRCERKFKCCGGCCWCACWKCASWRMKIECPPGNKVGYIKQKQSGWRAHFALYDKDKKKIFKIWGPCCPVQFICCPKDIEFPVYSAKDDDEDKVIANIAKQWTGAVRELFTDADTFGVTFPQDLHLDMKATLLGAVFLIDFMYFEQPANQQGVQGYM